MRAFDISPIIVNFYRDIFDDDRSNMEAYIVLVVPAVLALVAFRRPIHEGFISMMTTALAILFGFTFSSLLTTAKYSAKDDPIEEQVVRETRVGTSYALLANLVTLIAVIGVSIMVVDYATLSSPVATGVSWVVYFLLFHYLVVMVYLMRYLYLLVIGGAFEETEPVVKASEDEQEEQEITL